MRKVCIGRLALTQGFNHLRLLLHIFCCIKPEHTQSLSDISCSKLRLYPNIEKASKCRKNQDQKYPGHIKCRISSFIDNINYDHCCQNCKSAVHIDGIVIQYRCHSNQNDQLDQNKHKDQCCTAKNNAEQPFLRFFHCFMFHLFVSPLLFSMSPV